MVIRLIVFLLLNFAALAVGGLFTGPGVSSDWYAALAKAPWTPPGWVFGAAWTTIMICFGFFMAWLWPKIPDKKMLSGLYTLQWVLNVMWNPVFFYFHEVEWALGVIVSLTLIVGFFFFRYRATLGNMSILILPYLIWLLLATSLNAYIVIYA